jgi:hypothetical protein
MESRALNGTYTRMVSYVITTHDRLRQQRSHSVSDCDGRNDWLGNCELCSFVNRHLCCSVAYSIWGKSDPRETTVPQSSDEW